MSIIGEDFDSFGDKLVKKIGDLAFSGLQFEVFETVGGHLPGSIIFIERNLKLMFSGDILINIKGFTPEQARFNKLAPYLVTNIENNAELAITEREAVKQLLDVGQWTIIGGHGPAINMTI